MPRFRSYNDKQSALLPVHPEDQLPPGALTIGIHTLVEEER